MPERTTDHYLSLQIHIDPVTDSTTIDVSNKLTLGDQIDKLDVAEVTHAVQTLRIVLENTIGSIAHPEQVAANIVSAERTSQAKTG